MELVARKRLVVWRWSDKYVTVTHALAWVNVTEGC
jgi:hypothetical protein